MAFGSKIRTALAPRVETAEEIYLAISGIEDTRATRQVNRRKVVHEQRTTTTYGTPEYQKLQDKLLAFKAQDDADEIRIFDLWGEHADAVKREAAAAAQDWDRARNGDISLLDAKFADLAKRAEAWTPGHIAQAELAQGMLADAQAIRDALPMISETSLHPYLLLKALVAEIYRTSATAADWRVRKTEFGYPGTNGDMDAFTDIINLDQPEKIESLQDAIAGFKALARQDVLAVRDDHTIRRGDMRQPTQAELNELSAAAGRKIQELHPELSGRPYRLRPLEMVDSPAPPAPAPQPSHLGVDGRPVGKFDRETADVESAERLRAMFDHPPHDTRDFAAPIPDPKNPHHLPEPGQEPGWQPGIPVETIDARRGEDK